MANTVKKLKMPDGTIYELADGVAQNEITSLKTQMNNKSDINHNHDGDYDAKGAANTALNSAKSYADDIKDELLNGAGAAYDTLKELGDLIDDNTDAIEALETIAAGKANAVHTHTVSDINGLTATVTELNYMDGVTSSVQTQLNGKANSSDLSSYLPLAGGTMTGDINLGTNRGFIGTTASGNKFDIFRLVNATKLQVGGSYPELLLKGKNVRPTYNDSEVALMSDVNKKTDDYSIEIYNGVSGNPRPVKFISVDYTSCNSENGVAIKFGMVSGHGNGSSYAFLQDVIIKVTHTGVTTVDNFKYYGASTGTYDGAARQYGDIFWVHNADTKIVDFYVLMGQYARIQMTPWKRVTYSTGGSITQYSSATGYSAGTKEWGNNSEIAMLSDISALEARLATLENSVITIHRGTVVPPSNVGEDDDIYIYTGA